MKCRLRDIDPNPFRAGGDLAFREDALAALERSLQEHGFWTSLPVRRSLAAPGRYELVFGHHRLEVLRRQHGADHEVDVELLDLSDTQMLRRMAAENGPEYAPDALTLMQQLRATVEGVAADRIELDPVPKRTRRSAIRYAPSFRTADDRPSGTDHPPGRAYTTETVAAALGYTRRDAHGRERAKSFVKELVLALEAVERGLVDEAEFRGASLNGMRRIRVRAMRKLDLPSPAPGSRAGPARERAHQAPPRAEADTPGSGPPNVVLDAAPEWVESTPAGATPETACAPQEEPASRSPAQADLVQLETFLQRLQQLRPTWPTTGSEICVLAGHRVPAEDAIRDLTEYMRRLRPPQGPRPPEPFDLLVIDLVDEAMRMLAVGRVGQPVRPPRQPRSGRARSRSSRRSRRATRAASKTGR